MKYIVVKFDDDGMVSAVPAAWMIGNNVHLPPLTGRNLRTAILNAIPPVDSWEGYEAKMLTQTDTYKLAMAYAKKFANSDKGRIQAHAGVWNTDVDRTFSDFTYTFFNSRPIRRYTPNPTDEEQHSMELLDTS